MSPFAASTAARSASRRNSAVRSSSLLRSRNRSSPVALPARRIRTRCASMCARNPPLPSGVSTADRDGGSCRPRAEKPSRTYRASWVPAGRFCSRTGTSSERLTSTVRSVLMSTPATRTVPERSPFAAGSASPIPRTLTRASSTTRRLASANARRGGFGGLMRSSTRTRSSGRSSSMRTPPRGTAVARIRSGGSSGTGAPWPAIIVSRPVALGAPAPADAGLRGRSGGDGDRSRCHEGDVGLAQPAGTERLGGGLGERDAERFGARVPIVGVAHDGAHRHLGERDRHVRGDVEQLLGLLVDATFQHLERSAVEREGERPGQELVEHRAGRVHVGGRTARATFGLLGRHVCGSADDRAIDRGDGLLAAEDLGDAEVGDLERVVGREHEVLGLHVTVEHAPLVRELETGAGGEHRGARGRHGDPLTGEAVPERAARERFHHEQTEALALDVVVHRHDVRVREGSERARLLAEAVAHVFVGGERGRQLLDGDVTLELAVMPGQHHAHRAAPELAADLVARKRVLNWRQGDLDHRVPQPSSSPCVRSPPVRGPTAGTAAT